MSNRHIESVEDILILNSFELQVVTDCNSRGIFTVCEPLPVYSNKTHINGSMEVRWWGIRQ